MSIKFLCIVLMMGSLLQGENYMFRGSEEQRNMANGRQALVNADKIENGHQYFGSPEQQAAEARHEWLKAGAH